MNREYCERWLKSCLKKKVSITSSTIIMFLMTGLIMTTPVYGALNDAGTGSASGVAQGTGSNAVGADSIAIGTTANSAGDRTIAIGKNASTNNYESIAIGNDSKTTSNNNIAIGKGAIASGNNNSIAFGNGSSATGNDGALAVGRDSNAGGNNGIALGREAETTSNESLALGYKAKAKNENAVAVGREANATGNQSVAIGKGANASSNSTVALGQDSKATASGASALSVGATASGNNAVAISYNSKATATRTIAIGEESNANSEDGIALGYKTQATSGSAVAIGREVVSSGNSAVALGKGSKATGRGSLALATGANATGNDGYAIGWASNASAESTMAFGHSSKARKNYDIAFGREAETRDQGVGDSIAIGHGAVSGSNRGGLDRNGTDAGSVAIGTGAYTGVNRDNISLNSSVAIGAGAGAGFRRLDTNNNNMPVNNATDVDNNDEVLKKAFGVKNVSDYTTIAGGANGYTNVDINEATALGRNARAIGDQAVAIGAQTIAGHGAVALGGNDITQFADKKYYKSNKENFAVTETIDHNQDATLSDDTIRGAYKRLVGTDLDTAYKATYAQDGSVVLGAQAHSGTPLGTALGTNALIRKGAFGATAIGAGSQIQANADAAVAIGMGSRADGSYAVAAGTASLAALGDVAIGYQSEATGKEGAISIGQATKAKGDSSIIIGGANIASAASRNTEFISEKQDSKGVRDTYFKDITETINGETVTRRYTYVTLEDKSDTIEKAYATLTGKDMNKNKLDYNEKDSKGEYVNKNGHASTSVGVHSLAKGDLASAFGASSRANAIGSLALGTGAQALVQNSVAIGTGSIAGDSEYKNASYDVTKSDPVVMGTRQLSVSYDKDGKIVSDAASNIAYTFKWAGGENTAPGDIVSFGTKGAERQLKHVAAGRIAENSTDAVNGSQLNAIIERFIGDKIKYFSVKSDATKNHYNDGATGKDSIAIGPDATATKDNATATGNKSKASEENATAYGYNTEATGKSSVALGTSAIKPGTTTLVTTEASGENATALGVASKAKGLNSVALGYGVEANNNFATAIGSEAKVTADKGIAIGKKASVTVEGGIALGAGSVASVAGGQTGISVDGDVDGARTNVYENLKNNVNNSKISGNNGAVSVGSPTATRQIVNLAAGTNDTDAVNVAQLKSVNLAFKGNTGTGDVRLHDQRLAVESSNTDLLTVEASDKKLTFKPKTATLNIDNTTGSNTLGKVVAPTTDGLVKASELANTLNNMYWNVATSKNDDTGAKHTGDSTPQPVKAGETVKIIAGEHVTIGQNGRDITISMKDALTQVQLNNAIQQTFGNGKNTTLSNKDGVLKYSLDDNISLDSVTTGTTVLKNGKVTGLNDNLTNTEDSTDPNTGEPIPVTNATIPNTFDAKDKKNAATVGDVLNSGWNLQNNGTAKDFVRPYDTVNFVDGANTKAVVRTDKAGKVSNVTYNVVGLPMTYTDANGAPVSKVGDKYYKTDEAGNVLDNAGNPVTKYDTNGNPLNADGTPVTAVTNPQINLVNSNPVTGKTGTTDPTTLGNIKSGLDTIKKPDGTTTPDSNNKTAGLVKLDTPNVSDNNVATVGDLRNMGWVVSAEGNSYSDQVKNANEVNFVGKNGLTVTGKTEANGVRTITIENSHSPITYTDENGNKLRKVGDNFYPEDAVVNNGNVYPAGSVVIDGAVYPEGTRKLANGDIVNQDGNHVSVATPVASTPSDKVKATLNSVVQNKPTTLSNVGNNLKQVQDPEGTTPGGVKNPDGTPVTDNGTPTGNPVTITNKAPYTAKEAADIVKNAGNNAATVGDVLNAGWNLQGNGKAVDFVKPYDTVNFRDGGNTTVTYETNGTTSHMQVNVTGLPVTNTITDPTTGKQIPLVKVGDTYYPANADGTPNIQKDEYGNPTNGYTIADNGKIYNSGDVTFGPEQANGTKTKTNNPGATPVTINSNMSNPNVPTDSKNAVNTPTQLGNVANGAKTHNPVGADGIPLKQANDGNYYPATKVNEDGSLAIDAGPGMTYPPVKPVEMGNDGKWYEKDNLDPNGNPKQGATEVPNPLKDKSKKTGLIDFANSNPNNVATVGDLRNMGWVVSSDKTTGDLETAYNDQVRNANEVKFIGTGMATVSGKTVDGVRTITVDVDAQKTIETAQVPVVYTDENGNKLTKIGDKFYNTNDVPAGTVKHNGNVYPAGSVVIGDKVYPAGSRLDGTNVVDGAGREVTEVPKIEPVNNSNVKASMNSGDGKTNNPTVLSNVGSNLKQVVDPNGTTPGSVKNPDGTPVTVDGNPVTTTNKAPYTAKEIANMFQPHELNDDGTTKVDSNGKPVANKNYVNPHNAATVGDVLNTGWNLQNNGEARDFVKPYDTVNFVNGGNTTAVVTTDANGTTSHVTYNVTGLPVTYTNEAGKPVSKVGDNYYVVNDKGQPLQDNGTLVTKYNSKGNPLNDDGTPVTKQDTTTKPLKTNLVNPNVATVKQTTTPTQLGNVANGAKTYAAPQVNRKDVVQAKDGKWYNATDVVNGTPNKNVTPVATPVNPGKSGLVDFSDSNPTNVATVGDLRNMGWVVSSDKTTGNLGTDYNDQVRNANEVKFVGTGTATVSGKTDDKGVRTITVEVNDQVSTNNAVTPVVYTDKDGNQVYPTGKKDAAGNKIFNTKPDGSGQLVTGPVKTTINGPKGTTKPTTLSNVEGNLDGAKTGTTAPTTNHAGVDTTNPTAANYVNPHNAATVGDVLNAGWNLKNNTTDIDFVKPYDTVNFVDGIGTKAVVTTDNNESKVTFNIDNGTITYQNLNGKVKGSDKTALDKAVTDAQTALTQAQNNDTAGSTPATQAALKAAQDALTKAQNDKANVDNKVATVENVVEAINNSGFTLKADKTDGENLTDIRLKDGELIKPGSTVTMKAGKNMTVKQEANGNITYATKDDVEFNTVKVGAPETYKETATGDPVIKGKDGNFYKPADINNAEYIDGKYYPAGTVKNPDGSITKQGTTITATPLASIPVANVTTNNNAPKVNLMTEAAKPATNNGTGIKPTTALNVSSTDGKPTQITGVGSVLDSNSVITSPNGTATTGDDQPKLVNLGTNYINDTKDKPLAETVLNSAATVRDLANMGWVVSSDKATGNLSNPYKDVVKNANEVKFVGKNGIQVSGLTDDKGVRTLTFEMEPGEVTPTEISKDDGTKFVKVGDKAYKPEDIGTDGQPKQGTNPVGIVAKDGNVYEKDSVIDSNGNVYPVGTTLTNGAAPTGTAKATPIATNKPNNGAKFVTGNQVADAIEKSGFIVGKNNKALSAVDFKNEDEKVNPNDELRFADGDNTNVKLATKDVIDATGKVKTVTTVKVDVVDLPVKYTDADGNVVKKGEDGKYYKESDLAEKVYDPTTKTYKNADGTSLTAQPIAKNDVKTNLVNPNAGENKAGDPTQLGNVANGAKTFEPVAADGTKLVQVGDKFYPADKVENGVLKPGTTPADAKDPVKLANDGKWYSADKVGKNGEPEAGATPVAKPVNPGKAGLVDFSKSNPTNAATVGDLQNMGWVVSSDKTTGNLGTAYNDQVRNSNEVKFVGKNGIQVSGKTDDNGVRTLTFEMETGEITPTEITKADGTKLVKVGDKVYKPEDIGTDGQPKQGKDPVGTIANDGKVYNNGDVTNGAPNNGANPIDGITVTPNNGSKFVTGNQVADALEKSGFVVGKSNKTLLAADFKDEDEKVNPNDELRFADGDNTNVKLATKEELDASGKVKTVTYIKTDINRDINIDSVIVGDKKSGKDGALTVKDKNGNDRVKVNPNGMTITPIKDDGTSDPDKAVSLTDKGLNNGGNNITNVKGNLPQVNDKDKTVIGPDGKPYTKDGNVVTGNNKAPITAKDVADVLQPYELNNDGTTKVDDKGKPVANKNYAGSNAATVGDVLNAGWNLQNNGEAKDFVKPYDTVNFINGGNTTAVVTTDKDGTTSNVTYNITGLPISYTDKDGKPVSKFGDNYYKVDNAGNVIDTNGKPAKRNANGQYVDNAGNVINPINTSENPLTINLVNPNVSADKATKTPMKIGNIESGAKTFDAPKDKNGNPLTKANDGKWYLSNEVSPNGNVKKGAKVKNPVIGNVTENNDPRKAGLINFGHSNSDTTNAATVGDLKNMGWVVSTSDTGYNDQVRNANVVDFKEGEGIKISGETLEDGVRQIKVGIDKNVVATKQELAQVARLSSAGIAGVAAMANIPQINEAASNRYNIAVGVGYHKGEKALAVGISGVSDGGRVVYKASAALDSQKQTTVGLGVGYQFGKRDIEPNELDRFRAQLDLVNTQKSSLAQRLKEQSVEIEELKKQNKILNEKIDMILRNNSNK